MIVIQPGQIVPDELRGGVVAIGAFDGLHRGHQIILELARKRALDLSCPVIALIFSPHPRRFFNADAAPFLLTPGAYQLERLHAAQIDGVVTLRFDTAMANHTPQAFINEILQGLLKARHIVVGRDFHFGHDRAGTAATLLKAGIPVTEIALMVDASGAPYSSTRVRNCLQAGDLNATRALLGYDWEIRGTVIHGDHRGRTLGYPTANVALGDTLHPSYGVYAAWVQVEGEKGWRAAAVNIGIRPMFETKTALLEAHILDFSSEIYGRNLRVVPLQKLRDEARYANLNALIQQIERDCDQTRRVLGQMAA